MPNWVSTSWTWVVKVGLIIRLLNVWIIEHKVKKTIGGKNRERAAQTSSDKFGLYEEHEKANILCNFQKQIPMSCNQILGIYLLVPFFVIQTLPAQKYKAKFGIMSFVRPTIANALNQPRKNIKTFKFALFALHTLKFWNFRDLKLNY